MGLSDGFVCLIACLSICLICLSVRLSYVPAEVVVCLQYTAMSQSGLDGFGASGDLDTEGDPVGGVADIDIASASSCLVRSNLNFCSTYSVQGISLFRGTVSG